MPVISVIVLALWTVTVLRILGVRATLGVRTLATYLALGALLGTIFAPFVRALASPYGEQGPYVAELTSLGMQVVFLLPVIPYFFLRRINAATSIADAFLLAFAIGLGFDLVGALLAASVATTPLKGLSFWPPWQIDAGKVSVAGYGYWSALVALGVAAALRFVGKVYIAIVAGALVLFWVVTENASLSLPLQEKPDDWITGFGNLTLHGALTASIALIALVALSIWEVLWAESKRSGRSQARFEFLKHLPSLMNAIASRKSKEFLRLSTLFRLKRQAALGQAELRRSPDDAGLQCAVRYLEQRIQELDRGLADATVSAATPTPFWRSYRLGQAIVLVTLAAIVVFPDNVGAFFWSLPIVHFQFPGLPTILIVALMIVVAWCFLGAAGRPASSADANGVVQFFGERAIVQISLLAVLLVFFFTPLDSLYPFPSLVAQFAESKLPEFVPTNKDSVSHAIQLATVLLLFVAAACTLSISNMARWRRAAIDDRRRAALLHALNLAGASVAIWLGLAIYKEVLSWSHHILGAVFFKIQRLFSLNETFGVSGNTVGAVTTAFFMCFLCLGGLVLHRVLLNRLEEFFFGKPIPKSNETPRGHTQVA